MLLTENCLLILPSEKQPRTLQPELIVIGTDAELTDAIGYSISAHHVINLMVATFAKTIINARNLPFIYPVEHL